MKKNLKVNLIWFGLIIGLFLILKGLELSGIMNLYYIQILMGIGISILMGLGTNLVLGFSGQFTLGQAGFMAIGAYSSAIITGMMPTYDGFYLSMVVGVIIAAVVALIFGLPTLRLKGDYLAIATLGMAEIIRIIIVNGDRNSSLYKLACHLFLCSHHHNFSAKLLAFSDWSSSYYTS